MGKFIRRILNDTKYRLFLIAFSAPKHTKTVENTGHITLGPTLRAGLRHSTDGSIVFDVGGFEDVAALGAAELGDTSHHKRFVLLLQK